ncbi:MAG: ArnT family glycosyltransferase [Pseudomonadota bacterium]
MGSSSRQFADSFVEDPGPSVAERWLDWGWLPLFLLTIAASLLARPLMPVDETRYLAVAWEMWREGSWLVPLLNGEAYSHKPPLLFWLIHAGWAVFGVNEITPRLVGPAFALGSLFLLKAVARGLWPDLPPVARLAPWILLGTVYWLGFATMVMFDQMVVFFVLLGVLGLLRLGQGRRIGWWWLFLGTGLGVLAKGPFALVCLVPLTVSAPWWAGVALGWRWFLHAGLVGVLGSSLGLLWALAAASIGGPTYAEQILWGQMAGRAVDAFDHAQPFWYYLGMLPVVFLPWTLVIAGLLVQWFRSGGGSRYHWPAGRRAGVLALAWIAVPILLLSLASGKLPHYLLPTLPGLSLLLALWVARLDGQDRSVGTRFVSVLWVIFGAALALLPWLGASEVLDLLPAWTTLVGIAVMGGGILTWPGRPGRTAIPAVASASVGVLVLVHVGFVPLRPAFDFESFSRELGQWQKAGHPLAFEGKYRGEYDFHGRLAGPIITLGDGQAVEGFCASHPDGIVILRLKGDPPMDAIATTRFRSKHDSAFACPLSGNVKAALRRGRF